MEPAPKISQIALVLKCPRCQSTQLEQPPQSLAALSPHAFVSSSQPQPRAANPDSNIRCIACNSRWDEADVDTASSRYAALRKAYTAGAQT
jgi:phage FluMu protein Com